jgi:hypothetical protein
MFRLNGGLFHPIFSGKWDEKYPLYLVDPVKKIFLKI